MIVCIKTGKDTYPNKAQIKKNNPVSRGGDVSTYRCQHCSGWHFGSKKKLDTRIKIRGALHG